MADHGRRRSPARFLAPLALLAVAAAFALVILSFTSNEDSDGGEGRTATEAGEPSPRENARQRRRQRRPFYRVKLNDTLGLIAQKTGVGVEQLQVLNPELDPQNLVVGQRIKLRE
jgi:hypothetical protein